MDAAAKAVLVNYRDRSFLAVDDGYAFTAPVGSFRPNAWGLCDMHGNVQEWCQDGYDREFYARSPASDPRGPAEAPMRVLRGMPGASWRSAAGRRPASAVAPTSRRDNVGFRVAATVVAAGAAAAAARE